jgi:hypothetical protein
MRQTTVLRAYTIVGAFLALAAVPTGSLAHHGGDVEWGDGPLGPITGTAKKFTFQFPHVYVELDVAADGGTVPWTLVTRWTPTILREHGWSRDSIKPGDTLTVTYLPHVERAHVGQMVSIEINGQSLPLAF